MNKKSVRLVIISSITVFVLVVVLCTTTLMRLRDVSVEYATSCYLFNSTSSPKIIEAGGFRYGSNLLFTSFDSEVENIEAGIPYAKVLKIERKFPNKAVVHIEERTPVFMVHNPQLTSNYVVYDKYLKILHISNVSGLYASNGENSVPVLSFDSSYNKKVDLSYSAGQFLQDETLLFWATAFADGTYNYEATQTTIMSRITVGKSAGNTTFTIHFDDSATVAVITGENDLQNKIYKVVKIYTECGSEYTRIEATYSGDVFGS